MTCETHRPRLGELLTGAMADDEEQVVLDHVEGCADCAEELAGLHTLEEALLTAAKIEAESPQAVAPTPSLTGGGRSESPRSDATGAPRPARERRWAWRLLLMPAAAAALLALALSWSGTPRPRLVRGEVSSLARHLDKAEPVPMGELLSVSLEASFALPDGSLVQAEDDALLVLEGPRAVRLLSGACAFRVEANNTPFVVHTPRGTARVLGTTFLVEVRQELQMKTGVKASVAVTVVTLAVAAGVVLFDSDSESVRVEAGQSVVAGPDGIALIDREQAEDTAPALAALKAEKQALRAKTLELGAARAELEQELAATREEVAELKAALAAKPDASTKPLAPKKRLAISYGRWSELAPLRDADWEQMGGAIRTMLDLMPELHSKITAGEEVPTELAIKFGRENTKLLKFAIEAMGKLPTNAKATGNGSFTHPVVTSNLLVEHMRQAGESLSEAQIWNLHRLGAEFDDAWDRSQTNYNANTYSLQKLIDELTLKRTFYDGMIDLLSPAQRALVVNPQLQHLAGLDLYSPVLMLTGVALPAHGATPEALKAKLVKGAGAWGFADADLASVDLIFDTWISDLGEMKPVPAGQASFSSLDQSMTAVRAQLVAMKDLEARLAPSVEVRTTLRGVSTFLVPKLVE